MGINEDKIEAGEKKKFESDEDSVDLYTWPFCLVSVRLFRQICRGTQVTTQLNNKSKNEGSRVVF